MSKTPGINPANVNRAALTQIIVKLVGKQIKTRDLSGAQISQAQALAITSSTDFTWEHFAEILGDKYTEVKKTFGNGITSAREALGKLVTNTFKDDFTGGERTVDVSSDQNEATLILGLPKVVVKETYEKKGIKIVPSGKDGQELKISVDRSKVSSGEKERAVQIDIKRNGKSEKLTVIVQFVKPQEATAAPAAQPNDKKEEVTLDLGKFGIIKLDDKYKERHKELLKSKYPGKDLAQLTIKEQDQLITNATAEELAQVLNLSAEQLKLVKKELAEFKLKYFLAIGELVNQAVASEAKKTADPAAKPQTLPDHGKSADIVLKKDEVKTIELPKDVLLADSVTEGKVIGNYTVGKIDPTKTKFDLKATGEPKAEALKIPTKKGTETGEYTLNTKPPANGTGGGEKTFWSNWGAALTAGIAALVWIGALATKAEKTGSDILMGIVAIVAGGAIGGKWLGGFFGGDAKSS